MLSGQTIKVIDFSPNDGALGWKDDSRAVLYVDRNGVSNIWSQPIDGSAPKQLTNFKSDLIFTFEVSKDGKSLALARGTQSNDVVLIADAAE